MRLSERIFYRKQQERCGPGAPHPILEASRLILTSLNLEPHPRGNGEEDVEYSIPGPGFRGSPASCRSLNIQPSLESISVTCTDKSRATTVTKVNHPLPTNRSGPRQTRCRDRAQNLINCSVAPASTRHTPAHQGSERTSATV